jgi:N-hydroxyarylamine O-acetyltransferase
MNTEAYLKRIGVKEKEIAGRNREALALLQHRHMLSVPFENLDIRRNVEIVLDLPAIYEKVVLRRRGGGCYELNGLFAWLLERLGYRVRLVSARVFRPDGTPGPEFDHLALIVFLDRPYLTDVGFGDSARIPVPLDGRAVSDVSGEYRVVPSQDGEAFVLEKRVPGEEWKPQHRFTLRSRTLSEFAGMCRFHQTSPESGFTRRTVCTVATENGRITLSDDGITVTEGAEKRKILVTSLMERRAALEKYFGMVL